MLSKENLLLRIANEKVIECTLCPRLTKYISEVGKTKTKRFKDQIYWAKPVPTFGDPKARLLIIGLAPAAHGGNRTGRIFTGDSSGDWLYRALFRGGFASQPTSTHRGDGLELDGAYVTATCRCAPPGNRPLPDEIEHCADYLDRELRLLRPTLRCVLCLGGIGWTA